MRGCAYASEAARAARTGFWPEALRQHAETCSVCRETRTVAEALLQESARMQAVSPAPDASQVWVEARRRARLHLRHRALFWFRALRAIALIYIPAFLIWAVAHRAAPDYSAWSPSLRIDLTPLLTGPAETFAISGAALAALCITMGCWYLVREARTPLHASATR